MNTKETPIAKSHRHCPVAMLLAPPVALLLLAAPEVAPGQFNYTTNNGVIIITKYTGPSYGSIVTIPNATNGLPVTTIGGYAFYYGEATSVIIPDSVTRIGDHAFDSCKPLTNVVIPDSVTIIGDHAFYDCLRLERIMLPNSLIIIGDYAFARCSGLSSVIIPNSVISIGEWAFFGCPLTHVTLGNSITSIGDSTFQACGITNITIPDNVTSIGQWAFSDCFGLKGVYFEGSAPNVGNFAVFNTFRQTPTAYYLPGTTGWGPTYAGIPTAPWLPQIQTSHPSFGVGTNGFGFTSIWASGMTAVIEATTNLTSPIWVPLATNTLTGGSGHFSDPEWTNYTARFYRVKWP